MAPSIVCDDRNRLRDLLEGSLPSDEQAALAEHLEGCAACRRTFDALAAESRWWSDLRQFVPAPEADGLPPLPPDEPDTPSDPASAETQAAAGGDEDDILDYLARVESPGRVGRFGPYEVIEVLGRGGMGIVLKAFDPGLHRLVAVKVLAPRLAVSPSARRRFSREARAAASVCHDHVVTIHAVDETSGLPYLVMQYVAGKSLQERIDRTGPLEVKEVLRIGMQAAAGLAAAHAQGLIHRDVKPANILLENGVERVKITDFGLARAADDASLTQSGVIAGTPQYMSPEQARGEAVDPRSDLFSLGGVLYAMCTGRAPFRADSTPAVLKRVCEETPRPVREVNPDVPDWLAAIIAKLMAKDPADRYANATEVAGLLARHLAQLQSAPREAAPMHPPTEEIPAVRKPGARGWRPRLVAAALALVLLGGLGVAEAVGVTHLAAFVATVLRIRTPNGTLVLSVDDPAVKVTVDGEDVVLTGPGTQEIRLRPGVHEIRKARQGGPESTEFITITQGGKQTVRVGLEPPESAPELRVTHSTERADVPSAPPAPPAPGAEPVPPSLPRLPAISSRLKLPKLPDLAQPGIIGGKEVVRDGAVVELARIVGEKEVPGAGSSLDPQARALEVEARLAAARFDRNIAAAKVMEAKAQHERAGIRRKAAEAELARAQQLLKTGAMDQGEFDEKKTDAATKAAAEDSARGSLAIAEAQLRIAEARADEAQADQEAIRLEAHLARQDGADARREGARARLKQAEARLARARAEREAVVGELMKAKGELQAANAFHQYKRTMDQRMTRLAQAGAVSKEEILKAGNEEQVAAADERAAQAALATAEARLAPEEAKADRAEQELKEARKALEASRQVGKAEAEPPDALTRQAQADLVQARANREIAAAELKQAEAKLAAAMADRSLRERQRTRYHKLQELKAVQQEVVDEVDDRFQAADATKTAAEAGVASGKARLEAADARLAEAEAALKGRKAAGAGKEQVFHGARGEIITRMPRHAATVAGIRPGAPLEPPVSLRRARAEREVVASQLKEAQTNIDRATATRVFREKQLARYRRLAEQKAVAEEVVADVEERFETALAAEKAAEGTLLAAKARLAVEDAKVADAEDAAKEAGVQDEAALLQPRPSLARVRAERDVVAAELKEAQANLQGAAATRALRENQLARFRRLAEQKAVEQAIVDEAEAYFEAARAAEQAAGAAVATARARLVVEDAKVAEAEEAEAQTAKGRPGAAEDAAPRLFRGRVR